MWGVEFVPEVFSENEIHQRLESEQKIWYLCSIVHIRNKVGNSSSFRHARSCLDALLSWFPESFFFLSFFKDFCSGIWIPDSDSDSDTKSVCWIPGSGMPKCTQFHCSV